MFQSFAEKASSAESGARVAALRVELRRQGVDAFLIPRADAFQGEYIPAGSDRLRWITGFTGSAGHAVVLPRAAFAFSDGRYTVQLAAQLDTGVFTPRNSVETSLAAFLTSEAKGLTVGFDPWLHTVAEIELLEKAAAKTPFTLVPLAPNPVDAIWADRPALPSTPVRFHDDRYAGRTAAEKIAELQATVRKAGADFCVLADAVSSAWTFNIRAGDVPHKPLALAFSIVPANGRPILFLDAERIEDAHARQSFETIVEIAAAPTFEARLAGLSGGAKMMLDPQLTAKRIADIATAAGGTILREPDPAILPRARKNTVEIEGSRRAHRRDGAALTAFLGWLSRTTPGTVTEIAAAEKLEAFRRSYAERDGSVLRDISFETISAAGPNAALPHYRVTTGSNRTLSAGEVYLVDSGGQYFDATTDITRTVAIGPADPDVRHMFTLVLKGMIAVATARFPAGTRGVDLDPLARDALWRVGCDFGHGTGHGIGSYLGVHEGPQSISRRGMAALETGMIVSDEPGYYREGAFGIRIENLLAVLAPEPIAGGDHPMHAFEMLSFVPIDHRLIDAQLLSRAEIDWLDDYHARTRAFLAPLLQGEDLAFLEEETRPLQP